MRTALYAASLLAGGVRAVVAGRALSSTTDMVVLFSPFRCDQCILSRLARIHPARAREEVLAGPLLLIRSESPVREPGGPDSRMMWTSRCPAAPPRRIARLLS